MKIEIKIPSPGESISEVQLTSWFVTNGDFVEKNQEIAELESDKATLLLNASASGQINILISEGETIAVGSVACLIDTDAIENPTSTNSHVKRTEEPATTLDPVITKDETQHPLKVTPLAKEHLKKTGVTLDELLAKTSRIGVKEIESLLASAQIGETPEILNTSTERSETKTKMSPLRKKLSQRLVQVKNQTAMLTTFNEVNMLPVMNLRELYKNDFQQKFGVKLGFMSFFTKAASISLEKFPSINSMIEGDDIISFNYTDIGIAVQTPKGLMVPILRNCHKMTLPQIELEIARMAQKAREAKISLDEMSGGTFTITNGGVFGSLLSTPIINPPQAGILGMHNIVERPVAENNQVVIRPMMYIALSYDHRLVDGKDSVGFLVMVKELIEHPERLLLNGDDPSRKLIMG